MNPIVIRHLQLNADLHKKKCVPFQICKSTLPLNCRILFLNSDMRSSQLRRSEMIQTFLLSPRTLNINTHIENLHESLEHNKYPQFFLPQRHLELFSRQSLQLQYHDLAQSSRIPLHTEVRHWSDPICLE